MHQLEIDLVPGRNIALADLFDLDHARKVLRAFGRGSLMELETHLLLSQRVGLLEQAELDRLLPLTDRVSRSSNLMPGESAHP